MKKITVIFTLLLSYTCFSQSFWIKYAVEVDPFSNTEFGNRDLILLNSFSQCCSRSSPKSFIFCLLQNKTGYSH